MSDKLSDNPSSLGRTLADSGGQLAAVHEVLTEAMCVSLCLRDEEARQVQRTLDHTWTKLAYDSYLPCPGKGFLAASGAVSLEADHNDIRHSPIERVTWEARFPGERQ